SEPPAGLSTERIFLLPVPVLCHRLVLYQGLYYRATYYRKQSKNQLVQPESYDGEKQPEDHAFCHHYPVYTLPGIPAAAIGPYHHNTISAHGNIPPFRYIVLWCGANRYRDH